MLVLGRRLLIKRSNSPKKIAVFVLFSLLCAGTFAVDLELAHSSDGRLLNLVYLPFLLSLLWLDPKEMILLGVVSLALKPIAVVLVKDPALIVDPQWPLRVAVEVIAVVLCIWAGRLRCLLDKSRKDLEFALSKSLKAAALIHEVKQPISLLLHQSRRLLLQHEQHELDQSNLQMGLSALQQATEHLSSKTETACNLLRVGNPNAICRVELAGLIHQAANQHADACKAAQIILDCQIENDPIWLNGDRNQLGLMIDNLIINGIEALYDGSSAQAILSVHLRASIKHSRAEIKVSDSGMGFPCTNLERLRLRSSKANGLGMGLFIANQVAIDHGGCMALGRNPELGGAQVCVRLPLAPLS